MRILIVVSGLGLGGAERQVVLLAREFVRLGHAVCIYTLNRLVNRADELVGARVDLVVDQKRSRLDLALIVRLRRHLKSWQPDVVQAFLYDADIYSRLASIGLSVPVLSSERSDGYRASRLQRLGYRMTRSLSDGIVANSYAGAAFAADLQGRKSDHVHVVHNGIDLLEVSRRLAHAPTAARRIWPGHGLRIACMVGSIGPAKDYPLALRVLRAAIDMEPTWRLICVGDVLPGQGSAYKTHVLAEAARLGVDGHVAFVGHRRDVPEIMASSDVQLVTSAREGFPNVVLEAMACGTPVVSTDYSDIRHILPNDWQVVASRDPHELARALGRCLEERDAVCAAQRGWVERFATVDASANAMLSIYARVRRPIGIARTAR